jgi:hypothetical protein
MKKEDAFPVPGEIPEVDSATVLEQGRSIKVPVMQEGLSIPEESTEVESSNHLNSDAGLEREGSDEEIPIEFENGIAKLPPDIKCHLDYQTWATGNYCDEFSGTFGGKKVEFKRLAREKYGNWNYYCTIDGGERISQEKAKELWEKVYMALFIFDKVQKAKEAVIDKARKEKYETEKNTKMKLHLFVRKVWQRGRGLVG